MGQNINRCGAGTVINRPECAVDSFIDQKKAVGHTGNDDSFNYFSNS
jgi:hypothetical protein